MRPAIKSPEDILPGVLLPAAGSSFCEWKGRARYFDVTAGGEGRERAAWSYPDPTPSFADLRDHVAFYAVAMDVCLVDGERVVPQPGGFFMAAGSRPELPVRSRARREPWDGDIGIAGGPFRDWRQSPRVRALNDRALRSGGRYVLCWLQQALRSLG
ncbi:DUF427 domain-containing protein [Sphingomonas sp. MMS24-JH45]